MQLLGTELAGDPLQRFGVFRGQTIYVDIREQGVYNGFEWIGTPLADASGYAGLVERTVGELTTSGGTVNLQAGGSVVLQKGAEVNVSGGWIDYQGGIVNTTKVISGGHILDISQATPDLIYQGIYSGQFSVDHLKYGLTDTFIDPLLGGGHFESGYVYGGSGGSIRIQAPSQAVDGSLLGNTVSGARQRQVTAAPSTLSLAFIAQDLASHPGIQFPYFAPAPPIITVDPDASLAPATAFSLDASGNPVALRADRVANVILSPDLTGDDGFGNLSVDDSGGKITVPSGVVWKGQPTVNAQGSITLTAGNITIDGSIVMPGGQLSFNADNISQYLVAELQANQANASTPAPNPGLGIFTLGSEAALDVAGRPVDDRLGAADAGTLPLDTGGGSVTIKSYTADLKGGSRIDVSGGVNATSLGKYAYGKAGGISISAGQDPNLTSILGGKLTLNGILSGYSGSTGGSLSILTSSVQIGGDTANPDTLLLSPDFFSQGGFASFSVKGIGGSSVPALLIAPGTDIEAVSESYLVAPVQLAGSDLSLSPVLLPQESRAPVNLTFGATGASDSFNKGLLAIGNVVLGNGATVRTDPLGSVSFSGNTVAILGSVYAPGGAITVSGGKDSRTLYPNNTATALPTVDLGPSSILSTAGATILTVNARGYHTGLALNGGTITISGNIVAEAGALLDVSGISSVLDRSPLFTDPYGASLGSFLGASLVPTEIETNGGAILLQGAQELFVDATLRGAAGGSSALGGSLTISSGRFVAPGVSTPALPADVNVVVTQDGSTIPVPFYGKGQTAIGHQVVDAQGNALQGMGYFAADTFESSGMDALSLQGTVQFNGPVTLEANRSLTVATDGILFADSKVQLIAPYVALGTPFQPPLTLLQIQQQQGTGFQVNGLPYYLTHEAGNGHLKVVADLIDIGNLFLDGINNASFIADGGDIRGDGTLDVAGNIYMRAGQFYPPTEVTFNIVSENGSITFAPSGTRSLPFSAGGTLNVYASTINQGGVLRAPFGTINLGWNGVGASPTDPLTGAGYVTGNSVPVAQQVNLSAGSVTSVSAIDPLTGQGIIIPYGVNENGTSWIDPSGIDITSGGLPAKSITISGKNISDAAGAVIDIRGGGDLYAYDFVPGTGGTIDILNSTNSKSAGYNSFAVIPGYQAAFAPYGLYNTASSTTTTPNPYNPNGTVADSGYYNAQLTPGEQVYLGASDGLPAGTYTLLPARYALLPGAFLVTARPGAVPNGTAAEADGATLVSGYFVNGLDHAQSSLPLAESFEVDSEAVVRSRAEYGDFTGNSFLTLGAIKNNQPVPPLPQDGGHLVINALQNFSFAGTLQAGAPGHGALVDISTANPNGILIAGAGSSAAGATGQLVLHAPTLDAFAAGSLLIGGIRTAGANGDTVTVSTTTIEVDNSGSPLIGSDIILAALDGISLDAGAVVESSGDVHSAGTITVSGNGALLRVSGDASANVLRTGVTSGNTAALTIGANARISGGSVTLDSSQTTSLDPTATVKAQSLALNSGHIVLNLDGSAPADGLVLTEKFLNALTAGAQSLSLRSYQSIDIYGSGQIGGTASGQPQLQKLALHAGAINGYGGGDVAFAAKTILLDNSADVILSAAQAAPAGTLTFNAGTINLGANQLNIGQYANVTLNATGGILAQSAGGLAAQGDLTTIAPLITAAKGSAETISAGGALSMQAPASATKAAVAGGAGATLTFVAASITDDASVALPAGTLVLHAKSGDLFLGGQAPALVDVSGMAQKFFDVTKYTNGGQVSLIADQGSVNIGASATVNVSAQAGGGDAGAISITVPQGTLDLQGQFAAHAGSGGLGGSFNFDGGQLADLKPINDALNTAGFDRNRTFRIRTGDVVMNGVANTAVFNLSADAGSLDITGNIAAGGVTGGTVLLQASGDVTLESGAAISVAGQKFDDAGQGGSVSLETTGGTINISAGSSIDLSVAAADSTSASRGDSTGALHLRAPQINGNTDVAVAPLAGAITGAGSIVVEGYFAQDANTPGTASIDSFEAAALQNANNFMANSAAISTRLLGGNVALASVLHVRPGEEIDNSQGSLVLNKDWDLSTARFGPKEAVVDDYGNPLFDNFGNQIFAGVEPGILTLKAAGSITFNGSLSDGFGDGAGALDEPLDANGLPALWLETLLPAFENGASQASWSYRITAGADMAAADFHRVLPGATGSVLIGVTGPVNISSPSGPTAVSDTALKGHYQVIRTGAGAIDISAKDNVDLLNQFATVYTAGARVSNPGMSGNFDLPQLYSDADGTEALYPAQYSMGGGNVSISAGNDVAHLYRNIQGVMVADSERQMPTNWLYRRGVVENGQFAETDFGDVGSTSWWVDFSNFFEGVGALGGGNVSLDAGHDVSNVDAVAPTNARAPKSAPDASKLVELGGGDVSVQAGNDINAGVYYVERGHGILSAGHQILTNATRSLSLTTITNSKPLAPQSWLPTTLFLGEGSFDVSAAGDVLLGPVANPFLLPAGLHNSYYDKTYFSTYGTNDSVDVTSLGGSVTLREVATANASNDFPILQLWYRTQMLGSFDSNSAAYYQPWLRISETDVAPFATAFSVMPGTLRATAFSGDIDLVGNLTLSPAPDGTVDLLAAGSVNGLQPNGTSIFGQKTLVTWASSRINLSDASPSSIPGVENPLAYQSLVGGGPAIATTASGFLSSLDAVFAASGSVEGANAVIQTQQTLHAAGLLHSQDTEPLHLYAEHGNISGITLFSPKDSRVLAGLDLTDIALYIQNDRASDLSIVSAGRDIVAYDPQSTLRLQAAAAGNILDGQEKPALAGDIQISGPGSLEVLAGRNLTLGVGAGNSDGTGAGITSIGNAGNPSLPFGGADVIAAAGLGSLAVGLDDSSLDFTSFITQFVKSADGARYFADLAETDPNLGVTDVSGFEKLAPQNQAQVALDLFYLVLRDAGRDHNLAGSPGFGNYAAAAAAVAALLPSHTLSGGDIDLTSREIKTTSGGNISVFAPDGQLTVGIDLAGSQPVDQGILTEDGGNISIYTNGNVNVGTSRIFTLRGGNEIIYSEAGNIAAGASAKTVQSAPPTRVLIDPQSADVKTDLAGLATGGGIGVLATVSSVPAGSVDLIAPTGVIDAGDAGIRATGNLNLAAVQVLNASNIQAGGASSGVPSLSVAAPNIGAISAASAVAGANNAAANEQANSQRQVDNSNQDAPSDISVTVLVPDDGGASDPSQG